MRLVPDTDVLLSGLRSTVGASRVLLQAVEAGMVTPLVSVATVIEYEAVLKRTEHLQAAGLDVGEVDRFLDDFVAHADQITPYFHTRPSVRDPDDEMFAELAINGQADALILARLSLDLSNVGVVGQGAEALWGELVPSMAERVHDGVVSGQQPVAEMALT